MLAIALFFVAGIVLGMIGLALLNRWEGHPLLKGRADSVHRHHP